MGSTDIAPPHAPQWLVPLSTALLGTGVLLWCATYLLITSRSLSTKSPGMPLLGLALNLSWELVYALHVAESPLERAGFTLWLLLDVPVVWTTLRFAPLEWASSSRLVARRAGWLLLGMVTMGCWANWSFVAWWLAVPGRGLVMEMRRGEGKEAVAMAGDKAGKFWGGREGLDTTELAFWSAGACQLVLSVESLVALLWRGHSGGTGYLIWACRFAGTLFGMEFTNALLWWYWPEAHSYFLSWPSFYILGVPLLCDLLYPVVLYHVRRTEIGLPDGRLIRGHPASFGRQKTKVQ